MGLEATKSGDGASARLIAAGRTLLAQGDAGFSISRLCAEAGVTLADFRDSFASKTALMQQLAEPHKDAPQADPWLERRLRVFERALGSLEEKADKRDSDMRRAIAHLEEQLAGLSGAQMQQEVAAALAEAPQAAPLAANEARDPQPQAPAPGAPVIEEPNPLLLAPLEPVPVTKVDAGALEQARRAALAHGRAQERRRQRRRRIPTRMLVTGALTILLLLACAALTLVRADYAPPPSGGAQAHRVTPASPLAQLILRGDSGDVAAQRALARAYLRGDGVARDADVALLWARAAAAGGDAEAQYLVGGLSRRTDAAEALQWFARAAAQGHLKAMHSLGIAYAAGQGTAKDEAAAAGWFAKAAARGFVDSAFNLAVLYERGHGVAQDAGQALRWYRAAAKAGDGQAAARAQALALQTGL